MYYSRAISLVLLCAVSSISEATTVIYQWVDKNNVAHYSQQPPQGVEFKEIIVKSTVTSSTTKPLSKEKVEEKSSTLAQAFSDDTRAKCENARSNLTKLRQFEKIEATDTEGKSKVLSDIEKLQQIKLAEKQIEVYCR